MKLNEMTKDGAAEKPIKGLHNAKPGDIIEIGIEGQRHKVQSKIDKVVSNNRLQDKDGNIFGRDGMIYRRKGWQLRDTKGKIVSAKHMTQKQLDDEHDNRRRKYLKETNWDKLDAEQIEKILKIMRVSFGTIQKRIGYKDET